MEAIAGVICFAAPVMGMVCAISFLAGRTYRSIRRVRKTEETQQHADLAGYADALKAAEDKTDEQ